MPAPKPSDFKLESPPAFAGPLGSAPVVGDRYVHRDRYAEIVEVTPTHVVLEVADKNGCFRKSVTVDEFPVLEQRTLKFAVFKPAPIEAPNEKLTGTGDEARSTAWRFTRKRGRCSSRRKGLSRAEARRRQPMTL